MFRVLYGELCGDLCDLAEYETYLQMTDALCLNDCKSLADALLAAGSSASKTSEDKRLRIELSMIKQRLSRKEMRFQWVEGATMPADVLTKGKERGHVELSEKAVAHCSVSDPRNLRNVGGKTTSSRTQIIATSRTPRSRCLTTMRSISEFVSIDFGVCVDAA